MKTYIRSVSRLSTETLRMTPIIPQNIEHQKELFCLPFGQRRNNAVNCIEAYEMHQI